MEEIESICTSCVRITSSPNIVMRKKHQGHCSPFTCVFVCCSGDAVLCTGYIFRVTDLNGYPGIWRWPCYNWITNSASLIGSICHSFFEKIVYIFFLCFRDCCALRMKLFFGSKSFIFCRLSHETIKTPKRWIV